MKKATLFLSLLLLVACGQDSGQPAGNVIFSDSFVPGQMGLWDIEGDALAQTAVIDEQLVIELSTPHTIQFTTLTAPQFTDFVLEADVRHLRGSDQNSFGLLFRMQSAQEFYRFDITSNGTFMLERRNGDGSWTRFVDDWTPSAAINQGLMSTNHLKVQAVGRDISVYVNDTLLIQISDNTYVGGTIGLDAGTFFTSDLRVAFDNVVVSAP